MADKGTDGAQGPLHQPDPVNEISDLLEGISLRETSSQNSESAGVPTGNGAMSSRQQNRSDPHGTQMSDRQNIGGGRITRTGSGAYQRQNSGGGGQMPGTGSGAYQRQNSGGGGQMPGTGSGNLQGGGAYDKGRNIPQHANQGIPGASQRQNSGGGGQMPGTGSGAYQRQNSGGGGQMPGTGSGNLQGGGAYDKGRNIPQHANQGIPGASQRQNSGGGGQMPGTGSGAYQRQNSGGGGQMPGTESGNLQGGGAYDKGRNIPQHANQGIPGAYQRQNSGGGGQMPGTGSEESSQNTQSAVAPTDIGTMTSRQQDKSDPHGTYNRQHSGGGQIPRTGLGSGSQMSERQNIGGGQITRTGSGAYQRQNSGGGGQMPGTESGAYQRQNSGGGGQMPGTESGNLQGGGGAYDQGRNIPGRADARGLTSHDEGAYQRQNSGGGGQMPGTGSEGSSRSLQIAGGPPGPVTVTSGQDSSLIHGGYPMQETNFAGKQSGNPRTEETIRQYREYQYRGYRGGISGHEAESWDPRAGSKGSGSSDQNIPYADDCYSSEQTNKPVESGPGAQVYKHVRGKCREDKREQEASGESPSIIKKSWRQFSIIVRKGKQVCEKTTSKLDPLKMQFLCDKGLEIVSAELSSAGKFLIGQEEISFDVNADDPVGSLQTVQSILQQSENDVASEKLSLSKEEVEKALQSDRTARLLERSRVILVSNEDGFIYVCGREADVQQAKTFLEGEKNKNRAENKFNITYASPGWAARYGRLLMQRFPAVTMNIRGNEIEIMGTALEIDRCFKLCNETNCQFRKFSTLLSKELSSLLKRRNIESFVNEELEKQKKEVVWEVEDNIIYVYGFTSEEAKEGFRVIDESVPYMKISEELLRNPRVTAFLSENEEQLSRVHCGGGYGIFSPRAIQLQFMEMQVRLAKEDLQSFKESMEIATGISQAQELRETFIPTCKYQLAKEDYDLLLCLGFSSYFEDRHSPDAICSFLSDDTCIEVTGQKTVLQDVKQAIKEFKSEIKKEKLDVHVAAYHLMGKSACQNYIKKLLETEFQHRYMYHWSLHLNPQEGQPWVVISSRDTQTIILVQNIIKKAVVVRELATTGSERYLFESSKWKNLETKSDGKLLIHGLDSGEPEYEVAFTADLTNEVDELLSCLVKMRGPNIISLDISKEEYDFMKEEIKKMAHQFGVEMKKHAERYIIHGSPEQCAMMKNEFWRKYCRQHLEVKNKEEVDFILSRQGSDKVEGLMKEYLCAVLVNTTEWNQEPLHVYDFLNKEKAVHVSLMKGSPENMKVDLLICPVNTCLHPICSGVRIAEKGQFQECLHKKAATEGKFHTGDSFCLVPSGNLPCQKVALLIIDHQYRSPGLTKSHDQEIKNALTNLLKELDTSAVVQSVAIPLYLVECMEPTSIPKQVVDAISQFLELSVLQSVQAAAKLDTRSAGLSEIYLCSEDWQSLDTLDAILKTRYKDNCSIQLYDFGCLLPKNKREEMLPSKIKVVCQEGNLVHQKVDMIVNTVNVELDLGRGGISKVIVEKGGPSIQAECNQKKKNFGYGSVIFTGCGHLKCTEIAHGALPDWIPKTGLSLRVMKKIMWTCLERADQQHFQTIAFPPFGTGNLKYPRRHVARAMIGCIEDFHREHPNTSILEVKIILYSKDEKTLKAFKMVNEASKPTLAASGPLSSHKIIESRVKASNGTINIQVIPDAVQPYVDNDAVFELMTLDEYLRDMDPGEEQITEFGVDYKYDTKTGCIRGRTDAEGKEADFKKTIQSILLVSESERLTSLALIPSSDLKLRLKDQLSWLVEIISNHGVLSYLQKVFYVVDSSFKSDVDSILRKADIEEKGQPTTMVSKIASKFTGIGKNKPFPWKRIKFSILGSESNKVTVSIFGAVENAGFVRALLQSELDQLFMDKKQESVFANITATLNTEAFSKWRTFKEAKADLEKKCNVFLSQGISSEMVKISSSSYEDFQKAIEYVKGNQHGYYKSGTASGGDDFQHDFRNLQKEQSTKPTTSSSDFDGVNIVFLDFPMSRCEFEALMYFFGEEDWTRRFKTYWKEGQLRIPLESSLSKEVKVMIGKKIEHIRQMHHVELAIPHDNDIANLSVECARITKEEKDEQIYHFIDKDTKTIVFYVSSYEKSLQIKHKAEILFGQKKLSDGRRNRRFNLGPADVNTSNVQSQNDQENTAVNTSGASIAVDTNVDLNQPLSGPLLDTFTVADGLKVKVYDGSILKLNVECIVNAANGSLSHGGGVAYAISNAAGYEFEKECRDYVHTNGQIDVGDCCITSAGNLQYKHVIHTVGPRWDRNTEKCLLLLQKSVAACFYMADRYDIRTIALPAISSGIFGMPRDLCAQGYCNAIQEYVGNRKPSSSLLEIHFIDQDNSMVDIIKRAFNILFSTSSKLKHAAGASSISTKSSPTKFSRSQRRFDKVQLPTVSRHVFLLKENKDKIKIIVYKGNLLEDTTDAIVCPQDRTCSNQTQIAQELLRRGSTAYKSEVEGWNSFEKPSIYIAKEINTEGFFPFQYVLHAVSPRMGENPVSLFETNMKHTLSSICSKAEQLNLKSIGLPILGVGKKGFKESAKKFLELLTSEVKQAIVRHSQLREIHIVCIDDEGLRAVTEIFESNQDIVCDTNQEFATLPEPVDNTTPVETEAVNSPSGEAEDCCICMDICTQPKKLRCGHVFCTDCIEQQFKYKPACPQCGAVYGRMLGNQPPGRVRITTSPRDLPGYLGDGSIEINYDIPAGYQKEDHPNPGTLYEAINRSGHLPNNDRGRLVCKLLNVAFTRKLIFTIGHSRTTGKDGVVTWNDIHHKTRREGGPQRFGYPDPTYLDRVMEELEVKGVTEESTSPDEYEEYTRALRYHYR